MPRRWTTVILFVAGLAFAPTPVHAETILCTRIFALPATITVSGSFCLSGNLSTAMTFGNAIDIAADNVVLDLNGFRLDGLAAGAGTQVNGINVTDRKNVTIRNGTVRGFATGIEVVDLTGASRGHLIEGIRADRNTLFGMSIMGRGHVVRNNQIVATGGTTLLGPNGSAFGINVLGRETRVIDNDIIQMSKTGNGVTVGILLDGVVDVLAVNNRITDADIGIQYSSGATGKFRDNLTSGVATPFTGGTDAGNNN
jgi:hypothetical protein